MNGQAIAFCKIFIIAVLFAVGANALNAPYLTSATPMSDTSNVLTATTLKASEVFAVPGILVEWAEGRKFITIYYFDSSNIEKGFRLFKKSLTGSWAAIDSVLTKAPDTISWKSFADSSVAENTWYSYKVQIYNDSQTAFSPETTVYSYARPTNSKSYIIAKKGSIPAKPISWVERIGDSLYFPEVAAPGDTEIAVVDVSNSSAPLFSGYVDPKNIPVWLKESVIEARVKIAFDGLFAHRNGYYIVSRDNSIYQYDSASFSVIDSVAYETSFTTLKFFGWLNDSCCLIGTKDYYSSKYYNWCDVRPVCFGQGGIDTFPLVYSLADWVTGGPSSWSSRSSSIWGCYNNIAVFSSFNSSGMGAYSLYNISYYSIMDFSIGYSTPLSFNENMSNFNENISHAGFGNAQSPVIDTSVVFIATSSLYAFNIADSHSRRDNCYLGKLDDMDLSSSNVNEIQVDTIKKILYVIGNSGISIYSYSIGSAGVRTPEVSRNSPLKRISVSQNSRGVSFTIIGAKMKTLQVLNAKGQTVRSANIPAGETFVWNRQDNSGRAVPVGFYIYKIGTLKDGVIAGSLVLVR